MAKKAELSVSLSEKEASEQKKSQQQQDDTDDQEVVLSFDDEETTTRRLGRFRGLLQHFESVGIRLSLTYIQFR
ncbi:MAG: hypothetical protein IPJ30_27345 [Acidobacteria bacterium]|nr:hypothetical protein [Acidobacteriota bacterium]MBK8148251.1 hypothetical protein [Acidobacteriota bacterium]